MRACLFCQTHLTRGKDGTRSGEHILPKWVGKALGEHPPYVERDHQRDLEWRPKDGFSRVLSKVCRTCNETWMSSIEATAQPIVSKLMFPQHSGRLTLARSDQTAVAIWVTLRWLIWEAARTDEPCFYPGDYAWFYRERRPLPGSSTVLAIHDGSRAFQVWRRRLPLAPPQPPTPYAVADPLWEPRPPEESILTFHVRHLVVQATYSTMWDDVTRQHRPEAAGITRRVWPPRNFVDWPPPYGLVAATLDDLDGRPLDRLA